MSEYQSEKVGGHRDPGRDDHGERGNAADAEAARDETHRLLVAASSDCRSDRRTSINYPPTRKTIATMWRKPTSVQVCINAAAAPR
jgi:hypothetical protein